MAFPHVKTAARWATRRELSKSSRPDASAKRSKSAQSPDLYVRLPLPAAHLLYPRSHWKCFTHSAAQHFMERRVTKALGSICRAHLTASPGASAARPFGELLKRRCWQEHRTKAALAVRPWVGCSCPQAYEVQTTAGIASFSLCNTLKTLKAKSPGKLDAPPRTSRFPARTLPRSGSRG